jgi:hypothetical protein
MTTVEEILEKVAEEAPRPNVGEGATVVEIAIDAHARNHRRRLTYERFQSLEKAVDAAIMETLYPGDSDIPEVDPSYNVDALRALWTYRHKGDGHYLVVIADTAGDLVQRVGELDLEEDDFAAYCDDFFL